MRVLTTVVSTATALALACGGGTASSTGDVGVASPPDRTATKAAGGTADVQWSDPEPDGAQALAEDVLGAPWNTNKTCRLEPPRTQRLTMSITTLVGRTSNLEGFSTAVEGEPTSLEDRLADLGAEQSDTELKIRLPGSVLFDFDSAAIRPDAERTLKEVVDVVQEFPDRPVRVEGHTDAIASEEYNQALSERRARSVAQWLTGHGVDGNRLVVAGKGESEPVAENSTAEGRQHNRRVEIVIER